MAVYSATKFAVRAISEGLRQEAGAKLRVTIISPGFVQTNFAESVRNPEVRAQITASMDSFGIPPDAIARAIALAIEQPADVDVGEIIVRPTAQASFPVAHCEQHVSLVFPALSRLLSVESALAAGCSLASVSQT